MRKNTKEYELGWFINFPGCRGLGFAGSKELLNMTRVAERLGVTDLQEVREYIYRQNIYPIIRQNQEPDQKKNNETANMQEHGELLTLTQIAKRLKKSLPDLYAIKKDLSIEPVEIAKTGKNPKKLYDFKLFHRVGSMKKFKVKAQTVIKIQNRLKDTAKAFLSIEDKDKAIVGIDNAIGVLLGTKYKILVAQNKELAEQNANLRDRIEKIEARL
jgi:hypothetical protein